MDLRHLRYFVAVAEELNFRRAAERLHVSQPPLSAQIAQLETELGARLLERSPGQQTRLTPAGAVLLEEARFILEKLNQSVEKVRRADKGEIGTLTIGMTSSMAYGVVPLLLRDFRQENPSVALRLLELTTAQQEKALLDRTIDLAFCYPPLENIGFNTLPVCDETLVLAIPEAHPFAARKKIRLRDLHNEALLTFPRALSPGLYDLIHSAISDRAPSPKTAQEATQLQTVIALVCAGLGVAIVPESMAKLKRKGVEYRSFKDPMPNVQTLLVWRKETAYPATKRLITLAKR